MLKQQPRQQVYDRGDYCRPGSTGYTETSEEELRAKLRPDQRESAAAVLPTCDA
jgi:hypothetical protein